MAASKSTWNMRRLTILLMLVLAAIAVLQNGQAFQAYGLEYSEVLPSEETATELTPAGPSEEISNTGEKRL